jgi:hypothetical protein
MLAATVNVVVAICSEADAFDRDVRRVSGRERPDLVGDLPARGDADWLLARMPLTCCAADAVVQHR